MFVYKTAIDPRPRRFAARAKIFTCTRSGYDGAKKQTSASDIFLKKLSLLLSIKVHAANIGEREGGKRLKDSRSRHAAAEQQLSST